MATLRNAFILMGICAAILMSFTQAYAGRRGGGGGGGGGAAPPRPDPNTNPTVIADKAEISKLNADAIKLQAQIDTAVKKTTAEYLKTPEYAEAQKAADDASAEIAKAKEAGLAKLKAQADYKAATAKEEAARGK